MSGPPCPYVHIQGVNQAQIKNTPEKNSRKFQTAELEFAAHHQLYIVCGIYRVFQFSSVVQPCTTLCDPMNCSTPGFPVHHQLPEFTQTHVHQVKTHINQTNEDQTQRANIKSSKENTTNNTQEDPHGRITADLSTEALQARREWQDILKVMKEKNLQPRLLYPKDLIQI